MSKMHVRTAGNRDHPTLLLIHAMGTDSRFWDECISLWKDRFYCVAPDLMAAGLSPLPHNPMGVTEHAKEIEALRYELGIERWVAIGCAMGGAVAACHAAREPTRVTALVMANPGLRNADAIKKVLRERVEMVRAEGMAILLPSAADRAFLNLPRDDRYECYLVRYAQQNPEGYASSVMGFLDFDIEADIIALSCPILALPGQHDVLMPTDSADLLRQLKPDAVIETLPNVAHFGPLQSPKEFVERVDNFLSGLS